jgi:hypothetical protein
LARFRFGALEDLDHGSHKGGQEPASTTPLNWLLTHPVLQSFSAVSWDERSPIPQASERIRQERDATPSMFRQIRSDETNAVDSTSFLHRHGKILKHIAGRIAAVQFVSAPNLPVTRAATGTTAEFLSAPSFDRPVNWRHRCP